MSKGILSDKKLGLVICMKHYLAYSEQGEFLYKVTSWLPYKVQRLIISSWNFIACRIWGHFKLPAMKIYGTIHNPVCTHCCKEWTLSEEEKANLKDFSFKLPKLPLVCFSCDKEPQKYIDGLCEKCHQIAMEASDKME